jgi:lipid-binding SYLF domain-containing protein
MFRDADYVRGYVVFNIRRNRYRLITEIHYAKTTDEKRTLGHVYIRSFLTHKEYNDPRKWDRRFGDKADCVAILPSVLKFAIGIGGSYGRGVMTCRGGGEFHGPWGAPTMMRLGGGSVGLQLGRQQISFCL